MKWTDVVLYIVCFVTLSIAMFDLISLDQIEHKCLDDCNDHWLLEFDRACMPLNPVEYNGGKNLLNYTYDGN